MKKRGINIDEKIEKQTNKQGSKGRAQRNKKAVCWSEGVIHGWMGWWSDGKNPGTSSQRTSRRAMGGSKPSPGAQAQPWVSLLQTPPLISTQLAWSSICCLECHTNTHTHPQTEFNTKIQLLSHTDRETCWHTHIHTKTLRFHYP